MTLSTEEQCFVFQQRQWIYLSLNYPYRPIQPRVMCLLGRGGATCLCAVPGLVTQYRSRRTQNDAGPVQRLHIGGRALADGVIAEGSQKYRKCLV
jgi:hypothetical protein